uniref:Uncharacterized protein n=1 Tax=Oryza nivara TaxID=4536 RepID=A0A0E0IL67_ORYNI
MRLRNMLRPAASGLCDEGDGEDEGSKGGEHLGLRDEEGGNEVGVEEPGGEVGDERGVEGEEAKLGVEEVELGERVDNDGEGGEGEADDKFGDEGGAT